MVNPTKGKVVRINGYQQVIVSEDGDYHILVGMQKAKDVTEGDSVSLTYRVGPSYGLWFATKEN